MEISIIINNYKTRGLLKQCLSGIYRFPPSVPFEVIVVDNDSRDGSVEMIKKYFPQVKLIEAGGNLGHHRGNNLGIKNSSGQYLAILNTDIAVLDNTFDRLHNFLSNHPEAALVGPKLKNPDGSIQMSCLRFPKVMVPIYRRTILGRLGFARRAVDDYLMTDFNHQETKPVDWILGAFFMVRREDAEAVGWFDENLFLYFGDVAWCKEFWRRGRKVYYFSDTNVVHYHKRESAQSGIRSKIFWIHIFDWFKYLKKYHTNYDFKKNS